MNHRILTLLVSAMLSSILTCPLAWTQEEPQASRTVTEFHYLTTGPVSPARIISTEWQQTDRKIETQIVETPSINRGYGPIRDTETETIQVDANTRRVLQRWFSPSDHKLFQVVEEERRTEPGGREDVVRTTSTVDLSGKWQIQERDVEETVSPVPDTKETKTTVLAMVGGTLKPVMKSEETERRKGESVEVQKTLLTPDGGGRFQVYEERQTVTTASANGRPTEEKTYRKDSRGEMVVIEQTVSSDWQDGEKRSGKLTQTSSTYVPGRASDQRLLHVVEQRSVSATAEPSSDVRTEERVEQINPGAPEDRLRTSTVVTAASKHLGNGRTETHKEMRGLDGGGHLPVMWVTDSNETREVR